MSHYRGEKFICRRCEKQGQAGQRRPFAVTGAVPHYAPDLPFKLLHILLNVTVDPKGKTLHGTVTQKVRAVAPGQKHLKLDQIGLNIESASVSGKTAPYSIEGHSLRIELPAPAVPGEELEFSVTYSVRDPQRGLYFTGPDQNYPRKPYQVWSQGQDEDNRHWFPTFDYPNQKATSEVIATVPKGFTAISNGALLSKKDGADGVTFHYRLGIAHVTYLIALTVGEFTEWADSGPRGLPVQYFVAPGREDDGKRAFSNTPKMIEAYEKRIGFAYPYEKYSQVAVQDFIFGGMENTSATTQTDLVMHDPRAHLDFSGDPLVSHELAHQWFGDLLTCRDWSHGWLNEGFATFMERVWIENNPGEGGGPDEAKYYAFMDLKEHLEEDATSYRRPIVCNTYLEPIDLFDTHLYQKGGLVLNLIRHQLGEEHFWKSINTYVNRHQGQSVETLDLIRAIEDTTGRNLRRFFDEWVFSAGHPDFELTYEWHEDKKLAEIIIEQKQTEGLPSLTKDGATTPLFHLPVMIELWLEDGAKAAHRIDLGELRDRIFLPAASKPLMVRFDPNSAIPKTLKFPRPKEMLLYQLRNDRDCMGRIEAAKELGKIADLAILEALAQALKEDTFWGVQAEVAAVLGEIRMDRACDALILNLEIRHPKARRAVVRALGGFKTERASAALKKVAEKDASYFVEAEATMAFTLSKAIPFIQAGDQELDRVEGFLLQQMEKSSYREVIRSFTLKSMAELPGVGRGERPVAMQTLMDWSRAGKPQDARGAAIDSLGRVMRSAVPAERERILTFFADLADEPGFRTRMALVAALRHSEHPDAIPVLEKIRAIEPDGRARRNAITSISVIQTAGSTPESVANLKTSLEKLEEEYRKLRSLVEEQRAVTGATSRPAAVIG